MTEIAENYSFSTQNNTLNIAIKYSKFDAAHVASFKEIVEDQWADNIENVVIDFDAVDFIDSSGIGALLGVQKRLKNSPTGVTLLNAKPNVISVIELLRLHRVFKINPQQ